MELINLRKYNIMVNKEEIAVKADNIKLVHQGEYLSYYEIGYSDEQGHRKTYEMVSKRGSKFNHSKELTLDTIGKDDIAIVLIVLNKEHSKMLLVKEFRMGVNQYVYGQVTGFIDEGETDEQAAARELKEETGLDLVKIIDKLPGTFTCAPIADDKTVLIVCEAEGEICESDNVNEEIHPVWCDKAEAKKLLADTKIAFAARTQAIAYMWTLGADF